MRREIASWRSLISGNSTDLLVRGAEDPNSQPVSGHGVSPHLGTHLTAPHLHSAAKHSKDSMPPRTPKHRLIKALVGFSLTCFHGHSRIQKDGS